MSKSMILRFGTKNVDKARKIAARIAKRMREATKEGSKARALVDGVANANRRLLEQTRGSGLERRGGAVRGRVLGGARQAAAVDQLSNRAQAAGSRGLAGISAAKSLLAGTSGASALTSLTFLSSFTALSGPAGLAIQAAAMAVELLGPLLEQEAERQRVDLENRVFLELDRRLEAFDVEKRLREDPVFAAAQAEEFSRELVNKRLAIEEGQVWLREPGGLADL